MGNFQKGGDRGGRGGFRGGDRGGNGGGRGDFKKKSWGNDRGGDKDRGPVTMHRATCAECRQNCEVPFRPNGDRPVLCSDCFGGNKRDGDRGGRGDFKAAPRREFNDRPTSSSFAKPTQNTDELKKQLSDLTTKVDRLINLFEKSLKIKGEADISKTEPVIVIKKETKIPSLKTIIKKAVAEKVPAKVKKVITKKVK
jgi:CxxC-x17-CxxC domain-containing protein